MPETKALRVFVAGGSRDGSSEVYVREAYELGRTIAGMGFSLDFGLSNRGIMGAVARGVIDGWKEKRSENNREKFPIRGITTSKYLELYPKDDDLLSQIAELMVAGTLEERKHRLLEADVVVFAPGGVGTLDELAYDLVAMQDGFLPPKPIVFYNVDGYFYHIIEFLKGISARCFADPVPFIVVGGSSEIGILFSLLQIRGNCGSEGDTYTRARQLAYELPYFVKRMKKGKKLTVEKIACEIQQIHKIGTAEARRKIADGIEAAYLEAEMARLRLRQSKNKSDTATLKSKFAKLKTRKKNHNGY